MAFGWHREPGRPGAPGVIALDGWKLTLPVAGDGGKADIVEPAASTPPWMTVRGDGSLEFWAPTTGATTKTSQHPRSELNSLTNFTVGDGQHSLHASVSVAQVPAGTGDIIIGQIHGADDIISVPFVMLHYKDGVIRVVVKQVQKGSTGQTYQLLTGVPLGARFDYTITDSGNGSLEFSAAYGTNTRRATAPLPEAFHGATVRFQAGDYQLGDSGADIASDGGRVTFYALTEQT
jgi:Alginate lyase